MPTVVTRSVEEAEKHAKHAKRVELRSDERKAATKARNDEKREETKRKRQNETEEERRDRLIEAKRKRKERKQRKDEQITDDRPEKKSPSRRSVPELEDSILVPDHSRIPKVKTKKRGAKMTFFETPVPHHRHLYGLQRASLSRNLRAAILRAEVSDDLEIISGPPGTGKTSSLVDRVPSEGRVLLCAPTNVEPPTCL